ncbi:Trafficking protein particle complex subunit BET5 [Fusarium falciforme]|nr:Trafficking protein particle complex subunit BET5 [Fusarium falciforme]
MVVYSFHIFDRHTECIYSKSWLPPSTNPADPDAPAVNTTAPTTSSDDAKLLFGTVFSLRNMVRKLGGDDDAFISYRTAQYKLHFYETPRQPALRHPHRHGHAEHAQRAAPDIHQPVGGIRGQESSGAG